MDKIQRLEDYFSARPELGVASVYIFGSHAAGRAHRESDVDVGVLLSWDRYPTRGQRFEARVRLGSELIHQLKCNEVDVVILNDAPPLFARRIVWEGVRAFVGDAAADRNFLRDVQLRAADVQPFVRRMRRLKLEALAR